MRRIELSGERHPVGGPGQFVLGRAETLCDMLVSSYRARVRLIYLDPPFGTGDAFSMRVGKKQISVPAYTDVLDEAAYAAMMRAVLTACREMLTLDGSLYLHVDYRKSAHMRLLLDEIFGPSNFVNEIVWAYKSGGRSTRHYARKHDVILFYRKSAKQFFNIAAVGVPRGPERRNHMRQGIDEQGRVYYSIRTGGKTYTYHEDSLVYPTDVWSDIEHLHQRDPERTGYSTQKPEALLARIIDASSEPGDLVMDLFSGSGTTAAVAAQKHRAWVAVDASPLALATLRRRLLCAHREFSLFDAAHNMAFTYPPGDLQDPALQVERRDGQVLVRPSETPLGYMALGRVEADVFLPESYLFDPTPENVLFGAEGALVQAVDLYGKQGFWAV